MNLRYHGRMPGGNFNFSHSNGFMVTLLITVCKPGAVAGDLITDLR